MPETVDKYKKPDCKHYEDCLSVASIANWSQFHCRSCKAYEKDETELDLSGLEKLYRRG